MIFRNVLASGLAVFSLTLSTASLAASYGAAGCGLGSLVFGAQKGFMQVFAATLNVTGFQTVGITFGTSNCADSAGDATHKKKKAEARTFLENNLAAVKVDAARGEGQYLLALAQIMGCDAGPDMVGFNQLSQSRYGEIFSVATSDAIVDQYQSFGRTANLGCVNDIEG